MSGLLGLLTFIALILGVLAFFKVRKLEQRLQRLEQNQISGQPSSAMPSHSTGWHTLASDDSSANAANNSSEIGRASCRETVSVSGRAGALSGRCSTWL